VRRTVALFILGILFGCGSGSDAGKIFVPSSGHPTDWVNPLFIGRDDFHGTRIKNVGEGPAGGILFLRHCAACHGAKAEGKIGPNILGDTIDRINAAIRNFPVMRGHAILGPAERQAIADFLSTPGGSLPVISFFFDTSICQECHGSNLDGGIAKISCFSCHDGPDGGVGHPAGWLPGTGHLVHFHGIYGNAFIAACANCHGFDLTGGIGPRCANCHDGATAPVLRPFSLNNADG
jgi:hypothetical protein